MNIVMPQIPNELDGVKMPLLSRVLNELVRSISYGFSRIRLDDKLSIGGGEFIAKHLSKTATLNFSAPGAVPGSVDLTIAATGAALGDAVTVAAPITVGANYLLTAFVSAASVVTVRWTQIAGVAADPDGAGGVYRVDVWQH